MLKIVSAALLCFFAVTGRLSAQDFSWVDIGAENLGFQSVLTDPADKKVIFAGLPGEVIMTVNAGKSWRRVLRVRGTERAVNELAAGEKKPNIIYAATGGGAYRSKDLGGHWERIFRGKNESENRCTALGVGEDAIFLGTESGLFISRDDGRSWQRQDGESGRGKVFNIDTSRGQKEVVYFSSERGVFKSMDGGRTWNTVFECLSAKAEKTGDGDYSEEGTAEESRYFVSSDGRVAGRVYCSSPCGIYSSGDGGKNWERITGYGLAGRGAGMVRFSGEGDIFILTPAGVFSYRNGRWDEETFSLSAGRMNYLALGRSGALYLAAEKGLYRSVQKRAEGGRSSPLDEYLKGEPGIKEVQDAAVRYAEVDAEKISRWRRQAAKKALLPQVKIGLDRDSGDLWHWESGSATKSEDDILRRGRDTVNWDVSLTWDFSDLIWNDAQTSIDVRSKLMVELRDDILDQVNKLYFERLRVKSELDALGLEEKRKRLDKQLKLQELTASLDALTCGYYSSRLSAPASD
ncbi:MAG: hypothetical protein WC432_05710 [Candidatus Omnitrophota bacterium]|jgi:photosystem II stability/assembly factor-like uncharacterized protein